MITKTVYIKMWPDIQIVLWFFVGYIFGILKNSNLEKSV